MATYVEVNGMKYPASITGMLRDSEWNNRESKSIKIEMSYQEALEIFTEDISWNIIQETEEHEMSFNEDGEQIVKTIINTEIYDNSDLNKYQNTKETPIFKKGENLFNYHRAKDEIRKKKLKNFTLSQLYHSYAAVFLLHFISNLCIIFLLLFLFSH